MMELSWMCVLLDVVIRLSPLLSNVIRQQIEERRPEKSFCNSTLLSGRTVTCDNVRPSNGKFASETFTCSNMRVDGFRVRYWHIPGFGVDKGCSDGDEIYDSKNDIGELCRQMMLAHGMEKQLWVAYIHKASCQRSLKQRMIFTVQNETFNWQLYDPGNGYLITLRCMAVR